MRGHRLGPHAYRPRRHGLARTFALAPLVLACLHAAAAVAEPTPSIAITYVSRFGGDINRDGPLDGSSRASQTQRVSFASLAPEGAPRDLDVLEVIARAQGLLCARGRWFVAGQWRGSGCQVDLRLRVGERRKLELQVGTTTLTKTIQTRDQLIVALGDSVASGEGNPGADGRWLDRRCHRSAAAGFEQAARLVASANTASSLTFVNLACSGATIAKGLLGRYSGITAESGRGPRESQLERLRRLASARPVAAVLVSAGADDVGLKRLLSRCERVRNCPNQRLDPRQPASADAAEAKALTALAGRYDDLATALGGVVAPSRVLVSGYFDPLTGSSGDTCPRLFRGALSGSELQWVRDAVLTPLNGEVSAAADRYGWRFVGGIDEAFHGHGACAHAGDPWVRTASEGPGLRRALEPNVAGHLAIANRVAPLLALTLGVAAPSQPSQASETTPGSDHIPLIVLLFLAGLAPVAFLIARPTPGAMGRWGIRTAYLIRGSELPDPVVRPAEPARLPPVMTSPTQASGPLAELVVKGSGLLLGSAASLGFVVFIGGAIETVRFWAARYPVDQAVKAVSRQQLLVVGAQSLVTFAVLGAAAVILLWLLDSSGQPVRATRRGVALLVFAELLIALVVGNYGTRTFRQLLFGLILATILGLFVVDVALRFVPPFVREPNTRRDKLRTLRDCYLHAPASQPRGIRGAQIALQALPFLLLAFALVEATRLDHASDRWVYVVIPVAIAAVLLVAPWAAAGAADRKSASTLIAARVLLALVLVVCLALFIVRDEPWLAAATLVALVLSALALTIGHVSGERFLPFAVAVFLAAALYGGALACLRTIDSPEAQPVALLTKSGQAICGVWAGDGEGKLWIGQVQLSERGAFRRPAPRRSSLVSVPNADQVDSAVGPLQPIGLALDQALALRDGLESEHNERRWQDAGRGCRPRAPLVTPVQTQARAIAERVQPELVVDRRDGFWPVSVRTLFQMEDRRARVCRRVADNVCVRLTTPGDLPWAGGAGEWLDYPADGLHVGDEAKLTQDALGSVDPDTTAHEYFLVTHANAPHSPWTVQFWFFYTFNYQPLTVGNAGYHEGDWESIGLLLSAKTKRPRYIWMARHENEGQVFVADENVVQHDAGRLVVYAARGSHADYESCARQHRIQAPAGLIDDRPQCDPNEQLRLDPKTTPLTDLTRVPWACWRGRYGHHAGDQIQERLPHESADGPLGPLWQQHFGGVVSEPCSGVADPGHRDARTEEVLPGAVAKQLAASAGRLEPLIDSCSDWERPPASGVYLAACSPKQLARYVSSGLEDPGPVSLHIDVAEGDHLNAGTPGVPAVRRDPRLRRMDDWRVTSSGAIDAEVYAACQAGTGGRLEARFPLISIGPQEQLRLDDSESTIWRLRDETGTTVAVAAPHVVGGGKRREMTCG